MIGPSNGPFQQNRGISRAGLDFDFRANLYQKLDTDGTDMARTSTFTDIATVTRASKKTDAGGWDFTNGTVVGPITEFDNNQAAVNSTDGVLIEGVGATNEIRNSRFEGATLGVIGSGGVAPTNMNINPAGTTVEITAVGQQDGWDYIELKYTGTPTGNPSIRFDTTTQIAALNGETWTTSVGVELVGGSTSGVGNFFIAHQERSGGGGFLASVNSSALPVDSSHRRFLYTSTLGNASTAYLETLFYFTNTGAPLDMTLRVFWPMCEENAYASSPVRPPVGTPGAATRAADAMSVANGAWQNSGKAFSVMTDVAIVQDWTFGNAVVYSGADNNNRAGAQLGASNTFGIFANSGGVTAAQTAGTGFTGALGTYYKVAIGVDDDNFAVSATGATQATDTSGIAPAGAGGLVFGQAPGGGGLMPGMWVRDFRYFPERLTNAQLESLVGN